MRASSKPPWTLAAKLTEVAAVAFAAAVFAVAAAAAADWVVATRVGRLWPACVLPRRPAGIVIHHSATPPTNDPVRLFSAIDRSHASRGWGVYFNGRVYHVGYHYIIMPDGTVIEGRPEWMPGAHCRGHNDMIGICLVGDFTARPDGGLRRPTPRQLQACVGLVKTLLHCYGLSPSKVYLHRELGPTACPGPGFPQQRFRRMLESEAP